MPSKKNIKIVFDELESFYISYTKFRTLQSEQQESLINSFYFIANYGYEPREWKFIKSRIIPIRVNKKMRFFPEVVVEKKRFPLKYREYQKFKRKEPNFNYNDLYRYSEIAHVDNKNNLIEISKLDFWDEKKMKDVTFSYKWLAKKYPKLMCKTLKKAQNRLKNFISKKTLVYY